MWFLLVTDTDAFSLLWLIVYILHEGSNTFQQELNETFLKHSFKFTEPLDSTCRSGLQAESLFEGYAFGVLDGAL